MTAHFPPGGRSPATSDRASGGDRSAGPWTGRAISRRAFLDGVTTAAACAAFASPTGPASAGTPPGPAGDPGGPSPSPGDGTRPGHGRARPHPAALQGLRGDTPDATGVARALHDGRFWERVDAPRPPGESYDLVVVGAGISGVTAAYTWVRRHPGARVLILDGHDDIGGHARRTEFHPAGRAGPLVAHGGARALYAPSAWPPQARELLADLGAEPGRLRAHAEPGLYPGLGMHEGVFCDRETYGAGADRLVTLRPGRSTAEWVAELPIAAQAGRDLVMLYDDPPDWFPGLSGEDKKRRLAGLSYTGFLREVCRVHPDAVAFCRTMPTATRAHGADALGAIDAWAAADRHAYPGFAGLGPAGSAPSPRDPARAAGRRAGDDAEVPCLPEGPQSLVRAMVGRMVPGFAGTTALEDITTTWFDYGALDRPSNRVRVRLSSPVVLVRNDGDPHSAASATVGYFDGHQVRTVRAGAVIMACWAAAIPHMVRDLPAAQRDAMRQAVRMPVVCATAQLRAWHAFREAGVHRVRFTGAFWAAAELAPPIGAGSYRFPRRPDEPITVHLVHAPAPPGMAPAQAAEAGRRALALTPYAALEFTVREQLARLLGPFGFDAARDVEGLTVNRWGHGYAREHARPWDASAPGAPLPADTARRRFGRIAMAGADTAPGGDAGAAVSAAHRAVRDLSDAAPA
ncbi:NAD(P)-binding protein [Sphaerisporangium rhizosphaerae]|uniref:NAD(P)-binding protein n=1 Tax=Sphaerisporangium rhizosphaerae TaxID=2269375 RepID=A0ABW2NZ53_9ACTN